MLLLHGFPRSSATSFAHVCSEIRNILHYFCTNLLHFVHIVRHNESPPPKETKGIRKVVHGCAGFTPVQQVDIAAHLASSAAVSSASLHPKNPSPVIALMASDAAYSGICDIQVREQRNLANERPVIHATGYLIHVPHLLAEHHEVLIDHILVKPNGCFHLLNESTLPFRVTNLLRKTRKGIGSPWFIRFRDGPLGTSPHIQPIVRQHDWW